MGLTGVRQIPPERRSRPLNEPIAATHVAAAVSSHEPSMNTTSVQSPASLISPGTRRHPRDWPMARCSGADRSAPPDGPLPSGVQHLASPATRKSSLTVLRRAVCRLTCPHIGNVGVSRGDVRSRKVVCLGPHHPRPAGGGVNSAPSGPLTLTCATPASSALPTSTPASSPASCVTGARRTGCIQAGTIDEAKAIARRPGLRPAWQGKESRQSGELHGAVRLDAEHLGAGR